jgi:hypothetical protein
MKQNADENYIQVTQGITILIQISIMILPIVADFFVVFFSLFRHSVWQLVAGYGLTITNNVTSANTQWGPPASDVTCIDNIVSC